MQYTTGKAVPGIFKMATEVSGTMRLGEKVDFLLYARRLTHEELARRAGVSRNTITKLINAKSDDDANPSLKTAIGLAKALGVSVGYLGDDCLDAPTAGDLIDPSDLHIIGMYPGYLATKDSPRKKRGRPKG